MTWKTLKFASKDFRILSVVVDVTSLQSRYGKSDRGVGVAEILAIADFARSTVYRSLRSLCDKGLIRCITDEGKYKFVATGRGHDVYDDGWQR